MGSTPPPSARPRMTLAEFRQHPDSQRYTLAELINRERVIRMVPKTAHQIVVFNSAVILWSYAMQRGGRAFIVPLGVALDNHNAYEPDVIY